MGSSFLTRLTGGAVLFVGHASFAPAWVPGSWWLPRTNSPLWGTTELRSVSLIKARSWWITATPSNIEKRSSHPSGPGSSRLERKASNHWEKHKLESLLLENMVAFTYIWPINFSPFFLSRSLITADKVIILNAIVWKVWILSTSMHLDRDYLVYIPSFIYRFLPCDYLWKTWKTSFRRFLYSLKIHLVNGVKNTCTIQKL